MIVAIGVDTVDIARVDRLVERSGEAFVQRVFTDGEAAYCRGRANAMESFAARFAAKEAVMKCLGTGWAEDVTFRQIEVVREAGGAVGIALTGAAASRAQQLGIGRILLSLTHTQSTATAFAVAER